MIPVSEQFISFQGEGPFSGHRAVFLRTHACNLLCGGGKFSKNATWTCDTIPVFTKIQNRYAPGELLTEWQNNGWLSALHAGAHLVLTGGEPLIIERQRELIPFLELLSKSIFIEVETNGTFAPLPGFDSYIHHYNCSPKLSNSGMPRDQRLIPEVITWHRNSEKSIFKFVVASTEDIAELITDVITPFQILPHKIWLMPAASTRTELLERGPTIAALAARHGWNFSNRLHILLYDQTTGV
jgi:organic radical activating enzyme